MSDYIADESGPDAAPIESFDQLVEHFERGGKPRDEWRVGTEYEKAAVNLETGEAIPFSGDRGVEAVLRQLTERYDWEPQEEEGRVIALSGPGGEITLEPGGQIELSGRPFEDVARVTSRARSARRRADRGGGGSGGSPSWGWGSNRTRGSTPSSGCRRSATGSWGPYMTKVGTLGQRMMKQTATVQVNLDYESEADAIQKMRTATALSPIINGMFANSPISDGGKNGFMSYRGHIWTDTDPARCGMLPFLFEERAGFANYAEWALDAPMYFIKRRGEYLDMTGVPFRNFWKERTRGEIATVGDFALHLSTLFPETRLKTYIELRMVDSQPLETSLALSAIAKGVLYEPDCAQAAWDLVKDWSFEERVETWIAVHRGALDTRFRRYVIGDLARELLAIAEEGLGRQDHRNDRGDTEAVLLEPLRELVHQNECPATRVLREWDRDPTHPPENLIDYAAYRN